MSVSNEPGNGEIPTFSDEALQAIRELIVDQGLQADTAGLRLAVTRGGCAGLMYSIELAESPEPNDTVYESDGVRIFVDSASQSFVTGSTVTVQETAHGFGFSIENPNATQECGCGLSFR